MQNPFTAHTKKNLILTSQTTSASSQNLHADVQPLTRPRNTFVTENSRNKQLINSPSPFHCLGHECAVWDGAGSARNSRVRRAARAATARAPLTAEAVQSTPVTLNFARFPPCPHPKQRAMGAPAGPSNLFVSRSGGVTLRACVNILVNVHSTATAWSLSLFGYQHLPCWSYKLQSFRAIRLMLHHIWLRQTEVAVNNRLACPCGALTWWQNCCRFDRMCRGRRQSVSSDGQRSPRILSADSPIHIQYRAGSSTARTHTNEDTFFFTQINLRAIRT